MSPQPHDNTNSPVEFIDDTSETLLNLLYKISEEVGSYSNLQKCNKTKATHAISNVIKPIPAKLNTTKTTYTTTNNTTRNRNGISNEGRPISPPPMFSNKSSVLSFSDESKSSSQPSSLETPVIKVTNPDNTNQIVLSPKNLPTIKPPPPTGKPIKKAPPPPPTIPLDERKSIQTQFRKSTISNLRKYDSVPESFDPPITFLSLNDSTEQLVPRSTSPDSDVSSLAPISPRMKEKLPDVSMVKRKGGWL